MGPTDVIGFDCGTMEAITMANQSPQMQHYPVVHRAGFIRDPAQCREALALQIALRYGLSELAHAHWLIIRALR